LLNLEFIINTISLGSLYAMLALGLVIIYGILRLVNFAYGELIMIGGYTLFLLAGFTPLPWLVVAFLAVAVAMLTSLGTELVAFRPVREKSLTAMLVTSFAVSTLLQNGALLIIPAPGR
jgi:branched-chain amino acid transport system permease protein